MQVKVNLSKINKGSLTCENLSNISPDLPHDQSQNVQSHHLIYRSLQGILMKSVCCR